MTEPRYVRRCSIHAQLLVGHSIPDLSRGPSEYSWATAARLRQKIVRANDHGWHLAAGRLHTELVSTLRRCQRELETTLRRSSPPSHPGLPQHFLRSTRISWPSARSSMRSPSTLQVTRYAPQPTPSYLKGSTWDVSRSVSIGTSWGQHRLIASWRSIPTRRVPTRK